MAAKLLHSLSDDSLELQKQIGCMTGIFQLFDRPHILTGGRRVVAAPHHNPGISNFNGGTLGRESNDEHIIRPASTEKIPIKNIQEKQRISTESSRASYSSLSRSSSSSSLECNRVTQLESASFDRITFPETPSRDSAMSRQNRDLRDLVKDSMYREIHGLSVRAKTAEEAVDPVMKHHHHSPRLHSENTNASHDDLKESVLEAPWQHHSERRQLLRSFSYHARDSSSSLTSRDAPRFSYDGREVNRAVPFDVSKSTLKLKDLPRLSLDGSKAGSTRSLQADSRPSFLKSMQQDSGDEFDSKVQNLQQSSGQQARPPSVVAKLMGLETLPHSVPTIDTSSSVTKSYPDKDCTNISRPFAERDPSAAKLSSSSKNLWKEPNSPRSMKPLSRFPIEPAPWKHTDERRSSQKPRSRTTRAPAKTEAAFPSVYSEIEKRLKDLEFTESGKDLRALKQILEAMQSKKLLQSQKEALGSNFTSHKGHEEQQLRFKHEARSVERRRPQIEDALAKRNTIAARHSESPIVIMKPAKLQDNEFVDNRKSLSSGRTAKDLSSKSSQSAVTSANMKNDRTLKASQTSTRSQQLAKDGYAGSGKSSGSISPRLQQKKLELEKRARPPTPPDSSKSRRQPNKQLSESNSPGGRRRPKHSIIQDSGEKQSEINVESRNLIYHENENLVQSNASVTTSKSVIYDSAEQISAIALHEEKSAEFGIVPVEYSSPVSVLDNGIHKDDSPSSVRYEGEISMDKQKDSNVVQGSYGDDIDIFGSREYGFTSEMNQNKLQDIENLVQKLRRLNSSHDEAGTDYIASLCENADPDHRYISEILLASGLLLRDLGSSLMDFQFHPSGLPINPELFLVLEQTKASTAAKEECSSEKMIRGKLCRKLVFDTVNEILGRKLVSSGPSTEPRLRPLKQTRTAMNAQKLLRELCSEIEALQSRKRKCRSDEEDDRWKAVVCKDVMMKSQSESWRDFDDEISGAVLDIERSIFKDLVNEIVMGESAGRRRSFSK